jgi:hypothetical protein
MIMQKALIFLPVLCLLGLAGCAPRAADRLTETAPASAAPARGTGTPTPGKETLMLEKTPPDGDERTRFDEPVGEQANPPQETLPLAVRVAREKLSSNLNIPVVEIRTVSYERVQWRNSCLGFSSPKEMCADVITSGWRAILEAGEKQYEFHTNEDGSQVRFREGSPARGGTPFGTPVGGPPESKN